MNPIDRLKNSFKLWSTWLVRNARFSRLLGLPRCAGSDDEPGLILIQIDGLSYTQFQRALNRDRLPFIRQLLEKNGYAEKPFYSGLPSSTPAVQGELFYGIKTVVPAFEFIDNSTRLRHAMFLPASANAIARQLQQTGQPLLAGGSSYSNIYSGGADTARYCAETMNLESLIRAVNPIKLALFFVLQAGKLFRILGVACLELILGVYDFFKGMVSGKSIVKELKFIPTRLFVCVILRELIRLRVKMDATRGVPIIAANFFGYDEQAHRRGPGSAFAYWTLKGIDGLARDIYRTAMRSRCLDYRVVIYADHGQESVHSYHRHAGKPLKQAIREVIAEKQGPEDSHDEGDADDILANLYRRAGNVLFGQPGPMRGRRKSFTAGSADRVRITTMGPLGHVYLPHSIRGQLDPVDPSPALEPLARRLNRQAQIPLVLFKNKGGIAAVNDSDVFTLSKDRETILGNDHPFLDQTAEDLSRLCLHPNAGDLVVSGWKPGGTPLSFNIESGAHGGPGKEETRGFVLLPPCMKNDASWMRPLDLRDQIFAYFEKAQRVTLTIVVAVAGAVFGDSAAREALMNQIGNFTGITGAQAVETILAHAQFTTGGILTTAFAVGVLFWGESRVFAELQEAMNHIWNVVPRTDSMVLGLLWKRATSFGMILAVGFLLLVSLVISALLSAFENQMAQIVPSAAMRMVMLAANGIFSYGMITLLFAMIYKILPDAEITWRDVWFGSAVTAALFIAGKYLIGIYLGRSTTASAFGAAGSFMVFLIWIFFSVQIFFFGAELTQVFANRYGSGVVPIKEARLKRKKAEPSP